MIKHDDAVFTLLFIPFDYPELASVQVTGTIFEADRAMVDRYRTISELHPESFPKLPELDGFSETDAVVMYIDWLYDLQKTGAPFIASVFRGWVGKPSRMIGFGFDPFQFIKTLWTYYRREENSNGRNKSNESRAEAKTPPG